MLQLGWTLKTLLSERSQSQKDKYCTSVSMKCPEWANLQKQKVD